MLLDTDRRVRMILLLVLVRILALQRPRLLIVTAQYGFAAEMLVWPSQTAAKHRIVKQPRLGWRCH